MYLMREYFLSGIDQPPMGLSVNLVYTEPYKTLRIDYNQGDRMLVEYHGDKAYSFALHRGSTDTLEEGLDYRKVKRRIVKILDEYCGVIR